MIYVFEVQLKQGNIILPVIVECAEGKDANEAKNKIIASHSDEWKVNKVTLTGSRKNS